MWRLRNWFITPFFVYPVSCFIPHPPNRHRKTLSLRSGFQRLSFLPAQGTNLDWTRHIFVPTQLSTVNHVFMRIDPYRALQQSRYEGPYAVLGHHKKYYKLQFNNQITWIFMNRLKSAFILCNNSLTDHTYATHSICKRKISRKKRVRFLFFKGE